MEMHLSTGKGTCVSAADACVLPHTVEGSNASTVFLPSKTFVDIV